MLENDRAATPKVVKHIDRCLSCLSCMTTCPSGVHYMHLVDHARSHIEQTYRRPLPDRLLRGLLALVLPHPRRFRLALRGRSEEHTSELQSLMRISYAVFCLKKKTQKQQHNTKYYRQKRHKLKI